MGNYILAELQRDETFLSGVRNTVGAEEISCQRIPDLTDAVQGSRINHIYTFYKDVIKYIYKCYIQTLTVSLLADSLIHTVFNAR